VAVQTRRLIFLDTETTGLDPRRHRIWDIAYIIRDPGSLDRERSMFVNVDLDEADPFALGIGHFYDRHPFWTSTPGNCYMESAMAFDVARDFRDAIIVGAVPWFDANMLTAALYRSGLMPTWHYHLVDVETLAAGAHRLPPRWDFDSLLAGYGLTYDEADRHTALGDARMVRDLYDAVMVDD